LAANAVKICVDNILGKKVWKNAYAAIRPPGHHAGSKSEDIFGFCLINNVTCGVRHAQKAYGVKKIAVFDWDAHHGDSSQALLYNDPNVLYISFHRYENGEYFPGNSGDLSNTGQGNGEGFNLNMGWNISWQRDYKIVGNEEYIYAFERLIAPILEQFKPELTFVSAGFDSCKGDPLGKLGVQPSGYAYITKRLGDLTLDRRVVVTLEGGYSLTCIEQASECVFRALREEQAPLASFESGNDKTYAQMFESAYPTCINFGRIEESRTVWRKYWPCLNVENKQTAPIIQLETKIKAWNDTRD
jgi:histone deacetylase 6